MAWVLVLASLTLWAGDVRAEPSRWLSGMELRETADARLLRLVLARPARMLGYAPRSRSRLVEIRIEPASAARADGEAITDEESIRVPSGISQLVREVRLEPQGGGVGLVVVRFVRPVSYTVESERSGARILLRLPKSSDDLVQEGARASSSAGRDPAELLTEAGEAMQAGAFPRAIALYTMVVEMPQGAYTPTALEYLGLARQRNGQRAHARAEYELYLTRYPEGDGAERVRQRLDALRSARQPRRSSLKRAEARATTEFDGYGTIATAYQRIESFADLSGAVLYDSSQIFQADLTGLARRGEWDARARASGYYRYDYLGRDTGQGSRLQYLNLEVRNRRRKVRGVVGRQPGRGGGMLGRFDGALIDVGVTDEVDVGAVFGFPQTSSVGNGLDTSRMFGGMRIGTERWRDTVDAEIYVIGQSADGLVDRVGVGAEIRYVGPLGSLFAGADYDVYYQSLNYAFLSGSLTVSQSTWLNVHADHRNVPFLTTRNALIGRSETSLSALEASFTLNEIGQLAVARTARASAVGLGLEQKLSARWRIMGDVTATSMTGTPASGGVGATPGTGWEFAYLVQAITNDLLLDGDTTRVSLRVFGGRLHTAYTLFASLRVPVARRFQLTPLLVVDFRDQRQTRDVFSLRPGLQARYRIGMFSFEADVRGEWMQAVGSGNARSNVDQLGYTMFLSVRLDF